MEAVYDGVTSNLFIGKAKEMRKAYAVFERKEVDDFLAASQIRYLIRLVVMSKHLATRFESELQNERPVVHYFRHFAGYFCFKTR